jgi:hypothetical protein
VVGGARVGGGEEEGVCVCVVDDFLEGEGEVLMLCAWARALVLSRYLLL